MSPAALLEVADALDAAHVLFTLIRGDTSAPVLAIDAVDRAATFRALANAFADAPFYVEAIPATSGAALVSLGTLGIDPSSDVFRLFRADDTLSPLAPAEVQIEFWRLDVDTITLPRPNAHTRVTLPRSEAIATTVERYGRSWPTLDGMFSDLATDLPFDIDLVYSWVE
ncbi:MAG TPA: hypothetical protein VIR33_05220, partial [Thermopolyspora sp.]